MQAFTCTGTIFRHTIAANSFGEALQVALAELGGGRVILWTTPDVWTRRTVEGALLPCVVDAVPRFVVEREGGFDGVLELDADNLIANLLPGEAEALRLDSADHAAWLDAFQAVHEGGDALRRHVVDVATCRDQERHRRFVRALAGAYGLGPVPAWHGAILPALVALDIETATFDWETPATWFEADRAALPGLAVDALGHVGTRYDTGAAIIHIIAALRSDWMPARELRALCVMSLAQFGWHPPVSLTGARAVVAA